MKGQFYPTWYIDKKVLEQRKYLKKLLPIVILFTAINLVNIYKGLKEIEDLRQVREIELDHIEEMAHWEEDGFQKLHEEVNFKVIENLQYIHEKLYTKINFIKGLIINKEEIYLEMFLENREQYRSTIIILEENFLIKELSPIIEEKGLLFLKVKVEIYET